MRRLALEYPDASQRQYAAVSAVGFNAAKTKALVYLRLRSSGDLYASEPRGGDVTMPGVAGSHLTRDREKDGRVIRFREAT